MDKLTLLRDQCFTKMDSSSCFGCAEAFKKKYLPKIEGGFGTIHFLADAELRSILNRLTRALENIYVTYANTLEKSKEVKRQQVESIKNMVINHQRALIDSLTKYRLL